MTTALRSLGCALLLSTCALGCAAARSGAVPPQAPPPESSGAGPQAAPNMAPSSAAGGSTPTATAEPTLVDDLRRAQSGFDESDRAFAAAGADCAQMCKALASMQRAAEHLCELTKDDAEADQKRCTDARDRVGHARDRVQSTCGSCASP